MAPICFQDEFTKSNAKPIEYKGKTLVLRDHYNVVDGDGFKISIEQINSERRQGVTLSIPKHDIIISGQTFHHGVVLWQDLVSKDTLISIHLKQKTIGVLSIYNSWDWGEGIKESCHNGAAMHIEKINKNHKRYWCNDGYPDDNLNDIVFCVEKIGPDS